MSQRSDDYQATAGPSYQGGLLPGNARGWMCPDLRRKGSSTRHACSSMVVSQYTRVLLACLFACLFACLLVCLLAFCTPFLFIHDAVQVFAHVWDPKNRIVLLVQIAVVNRHPDENKSRSRRVGFSPHTYTWSFQRTKNVLLTIVVR